MLFSLRHKSLFLSSTDNGIIDAGCNLIYNTVEHAKYCKADECYDDMESYIVKNKQFQNFGKARKCKIKMNPSHYKRQEKYG